MPSKQAIQVEAEYRAKRDIEPGTFDLDRERTDTENAFEHATMPSGISLERMTVSGRNCLLVHPREDRGRSEVVYLHGGAFCLMSAMSYHRLAGHLANACCSPVLIPDYSLAPEKPFPHALHECRDVVEDRISRSGKSVALVGDSAGGGLVLSLLMMMRDAESTLPRCATLLSPWLDLTLSGNSVRSVGEDDVVLNRSSLAAMAELYLDGHSPTDPLASPLFGSMSDLPPIYVQVSGKDILRDDGLRLEASGLPSDLLTIEEAAEMLHSHHLFCGNMPEADEAIARISAFIRKHETINSD